MFRCSEDGQFFFFYCYHENRKWQKSIGTKDYPVNSTLIISCVKRVCLYYVKIPPMNHGQYGLKWWFHWVMKSHINAHSELPRVITDTWWSHVLPQASKRNGQPMDHITLRTRPQSSHDCQQHNHRLYNMQHCNYQMHKQPRGAHQPSHLSTLGLVSRDGNTFSCWHNSI